MQKEDEVTMSRNPLTLFSNSRRKYGNEILILILCMLKGNCAEHYLQCNSIGFIYSCSNFSEDQTWPVADSTFKKRKTVHKEHSSEQVFGLQAASLCQFPSELYQLKAFALKHHTSACTLAVGKPSLKHAEPYPAHR